MAGLSAENQLRDVYNIPVVTGLAQRIMAVHPGFDGPGFCRTIEEDLDRLSFGDRSKLVRGALKEYLPTDFEASAKILLDSLEPELDSDPGETIWDGFMIIPESEYIAEEGSDRFQLSMNALYEMTKRFSCEGAIRSFIERYPEESLALLREWTADENVHVRRLVSEGTRPRLPLAAPLRSFKQDPTPVLELLELLKDDDELYVRRSVANNLNDISKDNPRVVVSILKEWSSDPGKERSWLIRHALRTLLKQGDADALALLGYLPPAVSMAALQLDSGRVSKQGDLNFEFRFRSDTAQKLMIDYRVHFMKSNGKLSPKTFKWATKSPKPGDMVAISGKQSFKTISTRKHYTGRHKIEIMVNGNPMAEAEFIYE